MQLCVSLVIICIIKVCKNVNLFFSLTDNDSKLANFYLSNNVCDICFINNICSQSSEKVIAKRFLCFCLPWIPVLLEKFNTGDTFAKLKPKAEGTDFFFLCQYYTVSNNLLSSSICVHNKYLQIYIWCTNQPWYFFIFKKCAI